MGEVNDIRVSQGGIFSIPIVDAGGNGSKIPPVFGCPLRLPPRAPRVQERNPHIIMAQYGIRCAD
jgi:hypothetical protein